MSVSLIIAIKGSTNIELEGHIIRIGNGASTNTVRGLAAEKLGLAVPLAEIVLETASGVVLTEIDQVRVQQVVYVGCKEKIKDIIPGPRRLPMVGNLYDMLPDLTAGWEKQFNTFGNLVSVNILGSEMVGTNHPAIAEVFVKESEFFTKRIGNALKEIKDFGGGGLFTSNTDAEEWKLAHKLLMPAFSPRAIKAYQPEMGIIAQETIKVLGEYKPDDQVEMLQWCTNLTFETIGRIGFGYSFDLMHRDKPSHPFIDAMAYALGNSLNRFARPAFMKHLPLESNRAWERGNNLMKSIVDNVIQERKNSPDAKNMEKDLLGFMLNARDEHGDGLTDENIRDQVVTFLIAGHDTTANTIAWVLYEFTRNPHVEAKVLQEIANAGITSDSLPTVEQISSLKYLHKVLKETLRIHSPLRTISKYCQKDCVVPGGYRIKAGLSCVISILNMHLNPQIYPDPHKFDPERFTPEEEQKRSRYAWMPFSTGPRACIGMAFALQEAKTIISMFLHRFKFCYDGPPVQYDPKQATTKPLNMMMTIHPRTDFPEPCEENVETKSDKSKVAAASTMEELHAGVSNVGTIELPKATFLFGTQTGTAQDYANQLASQAKRFGFKDVTLCAMDQWEAIGKGAYDKKDKDELVVICTATYNGFPPDSAEAFNKYLDKCLEQGNDNAFSGVNYAVFGLGNMNWRTYQAFPLKVDQALNNLGAERFFSPGSGNADKDIDADFGEWCAHFWTHTLAKYGVAASSTRSVVPTATLSAEDLSKSAVQVQFIPPSDAGKWAFAKENKNGQFNAQVVANRELQSKGSDRSTRHIEIDITHLAPIGEDNRLYEAGDHIEIMPENSIEQVERVALGFGLILDSVFEINASSTERVSPRSMAKMIEGPCTVRNALVYYADILSPPSRRMLGYFAAHLKTTAPDTAKIFDKLTMPDENNIDLYPEFIRKHRTLLDLQMAFPQVNRIDLSQFLAAVNVMQPRRYSIASSPFAHPTSAHISVGVVDDVAHGRHYPGLASSFLKSLEQGKLRASLKSSKNTFSMPSNPETPLIMIAAGTGLSPFRGFLQERAHQKKNGQSVGPCVLFFGCRRPDQDCIYSDEMEEYVKSGVILHHYVAFSRTNPPSAQKYVQHALLSHAGEIWSLISNQNAAVYVCGSGSMSSDVRSTFQIMVKSFGLAENDYEAEEHLKTMDSKKLYLTDVWG